MKKIIAVALFLVLTSTLVLSLASCKSDSTTLTVYNWGEYISDGSDGSLNINKEFENYCKSHGLNVKVNYVTYDSNESMYSKLKSGAVAYDIIIPSDYMIQRLIKEDMLATLNLDNIPNYQYIGDDFKNLYYDDFEDKFYSVPYFYGMVGIIYNKKHVSEEDIGSWDLMWNEKYKGKILQFNNSRDAFGTAMYKEGIDVNTTIKDDWQKALDELKAQKPLVQAYVMDEVFNKMKNESAWIAPYYSGDFLSMYYESQNDNLGFFFPEEGTNTYVDAMCIPKDSQNKELAEKYIDFMLSKEIAIANAEFVMYPSPNSLVYEDEDYISGMNEVHENAMEFMNPDTSEWSIKPTYFKNLDTETLSTINTMWEDLKIENSSNTTIYIVCGVVVIGIIAFIVFKTIKKKKLKY